MFCLKCGKQIPDDSNVCMYCGADVSSITESAQPEEVETKIEEVKEETPKAEETKIEESKAEEVKTEEVKTEEVKTEEVKIEETKIEEVKVEETKTEESKIEEPKTEDVKAETAKTEDSSQEIEALLNDDKKAKKNNVWLVVLLIILILILIGGACFAFYWFTRPIYKINKAIANNDTELVCELYSELKSEKDIEYVKDTMYNYVLDLEDQYIDESIEYDFISSELSMIGKKILKGDKDFEDVVENVDELNASREAFEKAEKAYKNGDYETAYNNYMLVIKADDNYRSAQNKAEECQTLMKPLGTWYCILDFGDSIIEKLGFTDDYLPELYFPVDFYIELYEDGTGNMHFSTDSVNDNKDEIMDEIVDICYEYFLYGIEQDLSIEEIDEYIGQYYDFGMRGLVDTYFDYDNFYNEINDLSEDFEFTCEDSYITFEGDSIHDNAYYEYDGDTLSIYFEAFDYEKFHMEMPLVLEKL